jgi:glutathione S-transferase
MAQPAATDFSEAAITTRVEALKQRLEAMSPSSVEMPTFVYLDVGGIGWPIRALFAVAGQEFDDVRIPIEDWAGGTPESFKAGKVTKQGPLKERFPNGHLPLYVDKDVELQESLVIMEYLGKKFGLIGQTLQEELTVKQVLCQAYDAIFHFDGIFIVNYGKHKKPPEYAEAMKKEFLENQFPAKLAMFSRILARNPANSGFMVGSGLTVADLFCFQVLCNWYKCFVEKDYPGRFAKEHPELESYIQRVSKVPAIADFISSKQAPTTWLPNAWGELLGLSEQLSSPAGLKGLVASSL